MNKGRGLLLALVLCVVIIQMVSALNVFVVPYNSTKMLVNISDAVDIYSYEVNFNYNTTSTTVQWYNSTFLGASGATYGKTTRNNIVSVYSSRLDSGLTGVSGSGRLFNISHNGNLSLRFAYFILNDSRGTYTYYNETPLVVINLPGNVTYGNTTQSFNVTLTEMNHSLPNNPLGSVRFSLDGGITNYTMTSSDGIYFNYTYSNLTSETSYVFSVYANDSYGNKNYTTSKAFSVNTSVSIQPSCGDATCNGVETCSDCAADCGACAQTGGGGGGGGSSGMTYALEPDTMSRGLESALKVGDSYSFKIDNGVEKKDYNIRVLSFNISAATIRLSTGKIMVLDYAVASNIDLDGDGSADIVIEANEGVNSVLLYIKEAGTAVQCSSGGCIQQITKEIFKQNGIGKASQPANKEISFEENFIRKAIEVFFNWIADLFGWD
jgi:hypothetical protein